VAQHTNEGRPLVEVISCSDWHDFKNRWRSTLSQNIMSGKIYNRFIFRGQSCSSRSLVSSFDRKFSGLRGREKSNRYETLLRSFSKNLAAFADRDVNILLGRDATILAEHSTEVEVLAQHHGLPTRLLDWSLSIYVAAFFSFSQLDANTTGQVSVWALNARFVKDHVSEEHIELLEDFYPKNDRQLWQLGVFLLNKTQINDVVRIFQNPEDFVSSSALPGPPVLFRFDMPVTAVEVALDDLEMMRINSVSLFPGIEGVVRWLNSAS
jgi:hypothetical protein